ncbi:hypothetical protein VC83_07613 [Pseudogymnoascus destructans]|uniref:Uncharacterized protein n=1 Tax=Pseudogymnoascus destructans TaxID=655981 RepID=A0A176ZZZ7_9PEZI|nr:uncharacterized protein VC83_07613 [Pseudogymnoascus destructans]OAF55599.1 hypothetical protein VC83_07613 [Pseudogymnoascus destructans]
MPLTTNRSQTTLTILENEARTEVYPRVSHLSNPIYNPPQSLTPNLNPPTKAHSQTYHYQIYLPPHSLANALRTTNPHHPSILSVAPRPLQHTYTCRHPSTRP